MSTYTTHRALPEEVRPALPSPDELAESSGTSNATTFLKPEHDTTRPGIGLPTAPAVGAEGNVM